MEPNALDRRWIGVGIVAGVVACLAYPLMVFVPMPRAPTLVVAAAFGPALGFASVGLWRILAVRADSVAAQAGAIANLLAGAPVTCMLIVQLQIRWGLEEGRAVGITAGEADVEALADAVWQVVLGLDVAFDVFVGLGTLLFGLAMLRDPAFGRIVGGLGIAIGGVLVLGFNVAAFPRLPVQIGLPDPGPISGLWYLLVVIMAIRWWRVSPARPGARPRLPGTAGSRERSGSTPPRG